MTVTTRALNSSAKRSTYVGIITPETLPINGIFVFGSNMEGRHFKGAANTARKYFDAKVGVPSGRMGKSYAIVTKDLRKVVHPSVPKELIVMSIRTLYSYAELHPELDFYIAYQGDSGTSYLNGYTPNEMATMFAYHCIPTNIVFEYQFNELVMARNELGCKDPSGC